VAVSWYGPLAAGENVTSQVADPPGPGVDACHWQILVLPKVPVVGVEENFTVPVGGCTAVGSERMAVQVVESPSDTVDARQLKLVAVWSTAVSEAVE
jgi:hypothetical protein